MNDTSQDRTDLEAGQLRRALDAEIQRCVELQRQLDRANAGFEDFISTAAHDLLESTRDVAAFGQLMAETNADRFDPDAGAFLVRIREGAARIESLLADVVDYWSMSTYDRQSSPTDMEVVLDQALIRTGIDLTERSASVTRDPMPQVCGDFDTLTKVLHHLIRNAIEYCGPPSSRVHVSSKRADRE